MSAQSGPSSRERVQAAANILFASTVPTFASSSSRFDITSSVASRGIQARLIQWHRVGQTGLRCVVAFRSSTKPSYSEAVDAMADELEHLVAQQGQQQQQPPPQQQQQTPYNAPVLRSTRPAPLIIGPRTPTAPQEELTPSSLTPRANSANIVASMLRPGSSSTSSGSTIRPSTAPPGPIDQSAEHEALPPMPKADPDLTPKRSLTSRLTPFMRRQRDVARPQKTPTKAEKRTSSLQTWGSRIKGSREQKQSHETPMPRYTLDPNQDPSPSPKGPGIGYTQASVPPLLNVAVDKPKGPREQPRQAEEARDHGCQIHFSRRDAAVRIPDHGTRFGMPRENYHQSPGLARQTRMSRALQPTSVSAAQHYLPTQASSASPQPVSAAWNVDGRPTDEVQSTPGYGNHRRNRSESPGSERVWDDIEELTNLLIARQIQDQERMRLQNQEQTQLRQGPGQSTGVHSHMEPNAEGVRGRREVTRHPRPVRRLLWPLRSRSRQRSDEQTHDSH